MTDIMIERNWDDVMRDLYRENVPKQYSLDPKTDMVTAEGSFYAPVQILGGYQKLVSIVDFVASQMKSSEPMGSAVKVIVAENEPAIRELIPLFKKLGIPDKSIDELVSK